MNIIDLITDEARRQGVPVDLALKTAHQESGFRQVGKNGLPLTSSAGAIGVMQLMPDTAKSLGVNPLDAADNVRGGVKYLKQQLDRFGDPKLALAAYNAGPGRVAASLRSGGSGIPNIRETQDYVRNITGGTSMPSGADIFGLDGAPQPQAKGGSGADIFASAPQPIKVAQAQPQAPAKPRPNVRADVRKSAASGFGEGVFGLADVASKATGLDQSLGALRAVGKPVIGFLADHKVISPQMAGAANLTLDSIAPAPNKPRPLVYHHEPQTVAGAYARTAAQMLPNAAFPGSLPARMAQVVVPAVASETAGQLTKGSRWERTARMAGALAGAGAAGVRIGSPKPPPEAALDAGVPAPTPQAAQRAADYVVRKVAAAGGPQVLARSAKPVTAAESMGKTGEVALGALARRPGKTGDAVLAQLQTRQMGTPDRVQADFEQATGIHPEAAAGNMRGLADDLRQQAAPLYEQAYAQPLEMTARLKALTEKPAIQSALDKAATLIRNDPNMTAEEAASIQQAGPQSTRLWDYAKRALDDQISALRDPMSGKFKQPEEGRVLTSLSSELRDTLKQANPTYGQALEKAGDYLRMEGAFKDGSEQLLNPKVTEDQFANRFQALTDADKEAWKGGIANRMYELARNGKMGTRTFNSLVNTPRIRAKLSAALGPEATRTFLADVQTEARMAASGSRISPNANSVTSEYSAEMQAQDGSPMERAAGQIAADTAVGAMVGHPIGGFTAGVGRQIVRPLARGLADNIKTGGLDQVSRDAAGELLRMSPEELAAILERLRNSAPPQQPMSLRALPIFGGAAIAGYGSNAQADQPRR